MASIILQNLYVHPLLDAVSLTLLLLASFYAGFVIEDLRRVVIGWVTALVLSALIMFFILSLPLFLGRAWSFSLTQEFFAGIIVMIFRAVFPNVIVLSLLSAFLGAIISEKVNF
ncbi:MAG: hypothetical protein QXM52_03140 [Candidatus Bathyarchaeia archaeon]